jgi:ectoine hydroxylase-related dioxygenase (phytanoyl-CoA dioxygenase family)
MSYEKKIYDINELEQAHQAFEKDGIVFFNKLLPENIFRDAISHIDEKLQNKVDTESLVNLHLSEEWFANFVSREEFTNAASSLLGVDNVKIFSSMILNKPANGLMTVPWHQDAAYEWPLNPVDCASLWLALDDVTCENGAMKVAVGAHKSGAFKMEETAKLDKEDMFFSEQLQKSIPEKSLKDYSIIDVVMKKGCASFHHSMLPHASTPNLTNSRRCAFIVRYCRGDANLIKYPGMPREEYFKNFELFKPTPKNRDKQ